MMLRSAEADPHVIERVQLLRRRGVAWATRAEPPQPPPAPKCRPWPGEAEPPPGLVYPDSPLGPLGPPEGGPPECLTAEAARRRGADSTRRSGRRLGSSSVSQSGRLQGLTPPTSPSCRTRRCQRNDTRSFHGLWSPSRLLRIPLRSGRARPRETASSEPRFDIRGARARRPSAANRFKPTCNRDPFSGCPPLPCRSAALGRRRGAEAESNRRAFSARPPDPRWRVLVSTLDRSRGRMPGRCP
jgi:hypothetical protein